MTSAELVRRVMFAEYASKAGRASRQSAHAHHLTDADRVKGIRQARLNRKARAAARGIRLEQS